ncbi:MAG: hypothetical protein WDZ66_13405 [Steroidobacteraceae bacterium]
MKTLLFAALAASAVGCATLTEDAMTPVAFAFSDGTEGKCKLTNKRGAWETSIPATVSIRKSDDVLKYDCESEDGRKAFGSIESEMGGKIIASAVFLDFGITDAITDKHRKYPASFVIPLPKARAATAEAVAAEPAAGEPAKP